jgi:hypothetical protein
LKDDRSSLRRDTLPFCDERAAILVSWVAAGRRKFLGNGISGKLLLPEPSGWEVTGNPTLQALG